MKTPRVHKFVEYDLYKDRCKQYAELEAEIERLKAKNDELRKHAVYGDGSTHAWYDDLYKAQCEQYAELKAAVEWCGELGDLDMEFGISRSGYPRFYHDVHGEVGGSDGRPVVFYDDEHAETADTFTDALLAAYRKAKECSGETGEFDGTKLGGNNNGRAI